MNCYLWSEILRQYWYAIVIEWHWLLCFISLHVVLLVDWKARKENPKKVIPSKKNQSFTIAKIGSRKIQKKNIRLSEKLNNRKKTRAKQYFKGQRPVFNTAPGVSTTVRIVLPFNENQDSKFSAKTTLWPNGEDSTGVR